MVGLLFLLERGARALVVRELDEREAAALACLPVAHYADAEHLAVAAEVLLELFLLRRRRQAADVQLPRLQRHRPARGTAMGWEAASLFSGRSEKRRRRGARGR